MIVVETIQKFFVCIILFLPRFETKPFLVDSLYYLDRILTVVFFLETCLKLLAMGIVAYFGNAWYVFSNRPKHGGKICLIMLLI